MKKFSEISPDSSAELIDESFDNVEILTDTEPETETAVTFPPYMVDDPTFMGYPDTNMQVLLYQSTVFGILGNGYKTVLDVGCGRGDFGNYLFNSGYNVGYTGIDLSPLAVDVGKFKYQNLIDKDTVNESGNKKFELLNLNFDTDTEITNRYDWVFHITNLTIDYGNFKNRSRYEYLEQLVMKSLEIANEGVIFMLLNENAEFKDDLYINYSFTEISNIMFKHGYKFAIDNTDFPNIFKLIVLNNKF